MTGTTSTYSITIKSDIHQKAIDDQKKDEFKNKKKQRYKIEAKNAEVEQSHGFQKCKFTGLFGMKIQAYLAAIIVNSKRMIRLIQIQAENLTKIVSKTSQLLTVFTDKKKGAYYLKNNKLLFRWPQFHKRPFFIIFLLHLLGLH